LENEVCGENIDLKTEMEVIVLGEVVVESVDELKLVNIVIAQKAEIVVEPIDE
jgi:hypothetical protein